jgi:predicted helicase
MTALVNLLVWGIRKIKVPSQYPDIDKFINNDSSKISWSGNVKANIGRHKELKFNEHSLSPSLYRPFTKEWVYFDKDLNERRYQMPRIFPNMDVENRVISVIGRGATKDFCAFMSNTLPDYEMISKGQCFPLKLYENYSEQDESLVTDEVQNEMFAKSQPKHTVKSDTGYTTKDGISDEGLAHFQTTYPNETITKEDLFYYIYGLLHSEDYKNKYADNLSKELPRIPCVKKAADFWAFSKSGRALAELHLNYESVTPYPISFVGGSLFMDSFDEKDYRVVQMKFSKKADKSTVIYNHKITMTNIPLEAYDYVVNGKPALEWVMERQAVTTHKDSGIVNDANLWATETMHDAAYPLKLFQRVITVSLETMKIVKALPRLDIVVSK